MIVHAGQAASAKAVVDIYHGNAAGTGIQHAQKSRHAAEGSAVTNGGGYRYHRTS